MTNRRNRHPARRRFLKQAAAMTMSRIGSATALAAPTLVLATPAADQDREQRETDAAAPASPDPTASDRAPQQTDKNRLKQKR